ncbi:hypothetical protein EII17_01695 [Clostridiales bacterium COT073_COT-073]|nr:hypothetical protein EII17_01695 [Clostridiales bacterium COT073_COT-073]
MLKTQQKLIKKLSQMEDELDIFDYFIDKALAGGKPDIRKSEYQIRGCASGLWVKVERKEDKLVLTADSDSLLIKGIALSICEIYNGMTVKEAKATKITFLDGFDLAGELNESRRNGLSQISGIIMKL